MTAVPLSDVKDVASAPPRTRGACAPSPLSLKADLEVKADVLQRPARGRGTGSLETTETEVAQQPTKSLSRVTGQYAKKTADEVQKLLEIDFTTSDDEDNLRTHMAKLQGFMHNTQDYTPSSVARKRYTTLLHQAEMRLAHPNASNATAWRDAVPALRLMPTSSLSKSTLPRPP